MNIDITAVVAEGTKLARGMFALRGNHHEMRLSEEELAAHLTLAFEHGIRAAARMLTDSLVETAPNSHPKDGGPKEIAWGGNHND